MLGSRAQNLATEVKHLRSRKWTQATHPSDSVDTETFVRSHPPRIYQTPDRKASNRGCKVTRSNSCHACWKQVLYVPRYRHPGTQRGKKKTHCSHLSIYRGIHLVYSTKISPPLWQWKGSWDAVMMEVREQTERQEILETHC